jgi:hypothetical protein
MEFGSRVFDRMRDLIELCHIHLQRQGSPAQGFNLFCQIPPGVYVSQAERHIGASMRERERNGAAKSACGARD